MDMVEVRELEKSFKRFANRHKFATLKSAFVNRTLFTDLKKEEKHDVLKGISFSVPKGKTISIIGENGSGKSTLLKILAGIHKPTSGSVTIHGRISALIELGAGFHPEISGRENIYINGIILGLSKKKIQEKYLEIVRFAELEEFIENPVKTYSSGMHMRLGFSVAINVDPDVLLIDEVLAVGDASFVPKCLDKINEFRRIGKTIIFVSHDLSMVERISDEVIWLKDGKIEKKGYPKMVADAYMEYVGQKDTKKALDKHEKESIDAEENREKRWGSKEVEITHVKMRDSSGNEKYIFYAEEPVTIEFDVLAHQMQDDFVFGLAIFTTDGILCYGSNTAIEDYQSRILKGKGKVKIKLSALGLINGTYYLDIAVHKRDGYPFDYHHFQYTFRVVSTLRDVGIIRIDHQWQFSQNIKISR